METGAAIAVAEKDNEWSKFADYLFRIYTKNSCWDLTLKNWNCAELRKHKRNSAKLCVCVCVAFSIPISSQRSPKIEKFRI